MMKVLSVSLGLRCLGGGGERERERERERDRENEEREKESAAAGPDPTALGRFFSSKGLMKAGAVLLRRRATHQRRVQQPSSV